MVCGTERTSQGHSREGHSRKVDWHHTQELLRWVVEAAEALLVQYVQWGCGMYLLAVVCSNEALARPKLSRV